MGPTSPPSFRNEHIIQIKPLRAVGLSSELLRKLSFCSDLVTYLVSCKVTTARGGKDLPENEINIGGNRGERRREAQSWIYRHLDSAMPDPKDSEKQAEPWHLWAEPNLKRICPRLAVRKMKGFRVLSVGYFVTCSVKHHRLAQTLSPPGFPNSVKRVTIFQPIILKTFMLGLP